MSILFSKKPCQIDSFYSCNPMVGRPLTRPRSKNVGTVKVFDEKNGLTKNDKNAVLQAKVEKCANAFFYSMTFEEAPLRGAIS